MTTTDKKLRLAVEAYFSDLGKVRAIGGSKGELSTYGPLNNLLTAVGATLKPKVFCVQEPADQRVGRPDFGLYAAGQIQKNRRPPEGQVPERGVVEVKSSDTDAFATAEGDQVARYWSLYRLVLVTNTRDFVLVGQDRTGQRTVLESLRLANSAEEFSRGLEHPRTLSREVGARLIEFLTRVLTHETSLTEPEHVARLLASYARDGLSRVEWAGEARSLEAVRSALEEALGVRFEDEKGARFFRSTLVQTLFYGVFSAWVLWARKDPAPNGKFNWHEAVWHLRAPVIQSLFQQLSEPARLKSLDLVEPLDWTAAALDRVDHTTFFTRFDEGDAVPYFYEPFLEAFDPELRKELGVWYTPIEVVRYMVARVDRALKDDLGIAAGLADERVHVLDPCCGTGTYLAEVLRRIATNLEGEDRDALVGTKVKQAATKRVFGFEIMPAPFVVAHLQVGLTMTALDAPLADAADERPGVFLTNALTGWEPMENKPLPFMELEEERDRAEKVKLDAPILVILGNPPYNAFAGVTMEEERQLFEAYRGTRTAKPRTTKGLVDVYVRFFRMAERRIVEKTGRGVICFISNYSWLDAMSFSGMRKRYLEVFDSIHIDNLHGDRRISEYAPDGRTSETVFAMRGQSPGIKVGTGVALLTKSGANAAGTSRVFYRDFDQARADERRRAMLDSLDTDDSDAGYSAMEPHWRLGWPFKPSPISEHWFDWPSLPELFPTSFPGAKTNRDSFLVDIDLDRLKNRVTEYFDAHLSNDEIGRRYPVIMKVVRHFDGPSIRDVLVERGGPARSGFVRFTYRPFDDRWLYWEAETRLLNDKRADYKSHTFDGNRWLEARQRDPHDGYSRGTLVRHFAGDFGNGLSSYFPAWLRGDQLGRDGSPAPRANLSNEARRYLERVEMSVDDLFDHVLVSVHDPSYRTANAAVLRVGWPRIPVPGWPDGDTEGAAEALAESAARGKQLATLLDQDIPVPGVTEGTLRPELATVAVPSTMDGHNMTGSDFAVTAGWGHYGSGDAVMPGKGRAVERPASPEADPTLGETTFDIYLNDNAYWRNVPAAVWNYKLGGYQVLKKWLSYRERTLLGRPLKLEEVEHFRNTARRIAAILLLTSRD